MKVGDFVKQLVVLGVLLSHLNYTSTGKRTGALHVAVCHTTIAKDFFSSTRIQMKTHTPLINCLPPVIDSRLTANVAMYST